jgi:hypothetical protein
MHSDPTLTQLSITAKLYLGTQYTNVPLCPLSLFCMGVSMQLSEIWFITNNVITGAPSRWFTAGEVDREHVNMWPLFILEPDILNGAAGFTEKLIRLQHLNLKLVRGCFTEETLCCS